MATEHAPDYLPNAGLRAATARQITADVPVYITACILLTVCYIIQIIYAAPPEADHYGHNIRLYFAAALVMFFMDVFIRLWRDRPQSPIDHIKSVYGRRLADPVFLARLPLFALVLCVLPVFSRMKSMIVLFTDFTWDETFIAWDRALFFGYDAWEVLQPMLGFPIVTAVLAFLYHAWILLAYVGTLYLTFYKRSLPIVRQYLLGFFLSWTILGGLMATWLASVGPCFMGPLLGDNHFADQMAYLEAANEDVPIMTLRVQHLLVEWFHANENGLGAGISAMPSLHVAIAFLFYLAMRRISRVGGWVFGTYFVITWISSVHLAYHYAVDGLVSVIAVAILWKLSGAILKWWDARAETLQPALRTKTVPAE